MKRYLSLIICLLIAFQVSPFSYAEELNNEKQTIYINSESDLTELSQNCILDSFSVNVVVVLQKDITLTKPLTPIPTFSGEFDGNGHTISNFTLATDGSHQGLFRYVQIGGTVKNLNVEGSVNPGSSKCQVGGIAGVNYGTVSNCTFKGEVSGENYIGGIAGVNYGMIDSCISSGKIQGKRFTGGICGFSDSNSCIQYCTNNADINTKIDEGGIDIDKVNVSNALSNLNLVSVQDEDVVSDSGGIVGNGLGNVVSCVNEGQIGYPHYGYNVGGIAGRQSGYLFDCKNEGNIYGKNDVGGIVGQMEPFLLLKDRTTISDAISSLQSTTSYALKRLQYNSSQYTGEIETATEALQSAYEISQLYQDETDPQTKETYLEDMETEIQASLTALQELGPKLQDTIDYATVDFQGVNNSTYTVLTLIASALNGNSITNIYEDTSDETDEEDTCGRVENNVNNGQIQGDKNVGGIAGNMSIELDYDMEGSLLEIFQAEIDSGIEASKYESKNVCTNNVNNGDVLSKKDYCGGVVGYQDIGIVFNCDNYANISSLSGFCGGIVGRSNATIRNCHVMCELDGKEYVGGIAGYGSTILDCASLVKMKNATAAYGAIAGYAVNFDEDNFAGNVFVSNELGAIDGISYDGLAKSESFSEFKEDDSIPSKMKQLNVTFKADDKIVKIVPFEYGESIPVNSIPEVPEKNGYTGSWEEFTNDNLCYSITLNAEYLSVNGAIASSVTRGDSNQPLVLIDDEFDSSTAVLLEENQVLEYPVVDKNDTFVESYILTIEGEKENTLKNKKISVRYLPPDSDNDKISYKIYLLKDNEWQETEASQVGSYLEFNSDSESVTFCVYSHKNIYIKYLIFGIGSAVLVLIIILLIRKNKAKNSFIEDKKQKSDDGENAGNSSDEKILNKKSKRKTKAYKVENLKNEDGDLY